MGKLRKQTTVLCKVEGCDRLADGSRGWCWAHYMRWYQSGNEPTGPVATQRRIPALCAVPGCDRTARDGNVCGPHGKRIKRGGDLARPIRAQAGNGKGPERWLASTGYVWVRRPDHPNAYRNGTLQEHTVVMAEKLGRPLRRGENVHHINGVKADNRPENLELWLTRQPKGQRAIDLLGWAEEIVATYGPIRDRLT